MAKFGIYETRVTTATVVGGSLAGLMTAISLAREGIEVTILEKSGEHRPLGAGLQVNHSGALFQTETEKLLKHLASGGKKGVQLWGSIESRLKTEAKADSRINLHYHTRVQTIGQNHDITWAKTDEGELFYSDMLIGADGHRSIVRRHVAPHKPHATFAGFVVWMASVDSEDIPMEIQPHLKIGKVTMLDGGMNGFLFGSILDKPSVSSSKGHHRIGCAWYDNSRNDLFRQLGCIEGEVVSYKLNGADIPEATLHELIDQASEKWP